MHNWSQPDLKEFPSEEQFLTSLMRLQIRDTLWEHFGQSDQSALIDMSLSKENPMKAVLILIHATKRSAEQTSMRTKCV